MYYINDITICILGLAQQNLSYTRFMFLAVFQTEGQTQEFISCEFWPWQVIRSFCTRHKVLSCLVS